MPASNASYDLVLNNSFLRIDMPSLDYNAREILKQRVIFFKSPQILVSNALVPSSTSRMGKALIHYVHDVLPFSRLL